MAFAVLMTLSLLIVLAAEAGKYQIHLGTNKVWRVHRSGSVRLVNKNVPLDKYHKYLRNANYTRGGRWIAWAGPCVPGGINPKKRRVVFQGYPRQDFRTASVRGGECFGIETINPAGIRTPWMYYVIVP